MEATQHFVGVGSALEDLDRDLFRELLVRSLGEIYGAHAAAADLAQNAVIADTLAGARCLFVQRAQTGIEIIRERLDLFAGAGEERFHLAAHAGVVATCALHEAGALRRFELERVTDDTLDVLPALRSHGRDRRAAPSEQRGEVSGMRGSGVRATRLGRRSAVSLP